MTKYFILFIIVIISTTAFSQQFRTGKYFLRNGLALSGYDAVAYQTLNKAIKGKPEFEVIMDDTKYRFSSKEHKNIFLANPEKYKPAYGGFCAYGFAMHDENQGFARGRYQANPESFKMVKGKLYLFYDHNYLRLWNQSEAYFKKRSDEMWKKVENE